MQSVYVHDLTVHYLVNEFIIKNIDPDKYCFFDMLNDVYEVTLKDIPSDVNSSISLSCGIHGSMQKIHVKEDVDVVKMFHLNNKSTVIHVYIDGVQFSQPLVVILLCCVTTLVDNLVVLLCVMMLLCCFCMQCCFAATVCSAAVLVIITVVARLCAVMLFMLLLGILRSKAGRPLQQLRLIFVTDFVWQTVFASGPIWASYCKEKENCGFQPKAKAWMMDLS